MPRLEGSADLLEDRRKRALAKLDSGPARVRPCQPAAPGARCPAEKEDSRRAGIGYPRLATQEAVLDRLPEQQVSALLAKLQAPPLNEITDMPTLVQVVQGPESIINGSHPRAA